MPVKIGDNLTLEDNKLSAVYKELYTKLNRAYAWTNTITTSQGGNAIVLYGGNILSTIDCQNSSFISENVKPFTWNTKYFLPICIINSSLYFYNSGSLYKLLDNVKSATYADTYGLLVITTDNYLKKYTLNKSTNTATLNYTFLDTGWTDIGEGTNANGVEYICGIYNNKLYHINYNNPTSYPPILLNETDTWVKCSGKYALNASGYLFYIPSTQAASIYQISTKIWKDIKFRYYYDGACPSLDINNNLYDVSKSGVETLLCTNVLSYETVTYSSANTSIITNDNKLKLFTNNSIKYNIDNNISWTDCSSWNGTNLYAIGDGKLYYITASSSSTSTPTFTQIGTSSTYNKLVGGGAGSNISVAWMGEEETITKTVYTTKNPVINDEIYENEKLLSILSNVTAVNPGNNSISDIYRTYYRDITKNSSFSKTPPGTNHEYLSINDILSATNPNN